MHNLVEPKEVAVVGCRSVTVTIMSAGVANVDVAIATNTVDYTVYGTLPLSPE